MTLAPRGSEIVAELAAGREWWRLRAGDVSPWVKSLHPSATQQLASRTEWIGEPWDGLSDIVFDQLVVTAAKVARILLEFGRALRRLKLAGVSIPNVGNVRHCLGGSGGRHVLVFDVDLVDFVLPIGIDGWALQRDAGTSCKTIASKMAEHVRMADKKRRKIIARELRLRRAVMETAATVGEGVAPLWLRMDAVPFHEDPKHAGDYAYVMLLVTLNDCLRWSPVGSERIWTVKDVRDHRTWYGRTQRSRATALATQTAGGSAGSISEIALAIIEERGLDPVATFRQALEASLADRHGCVELGRDGKPETLHYVDGVLQASFGFAGGHYSPGWLTLWGDWPEQLGIGARNRPLAAFVSHPAFLSTNVKVTRGTVRTRALDLRHRIRCTSVEAVARAREASIAMAP